MRSRFTVIRSRMSIQVFKTLLKIHKLKGLGDRKGEEKFKHLWGVTWLIIIFPKGPYNENLQTKLITQLTAFHAFRNAASARKWLIVLLFSCFRKILCLLDPIGSLGILGILCVFVTYSRFYTIYPKFPRFLKINPSEPKWTQVSPSEPKWTRVNPSEPK